MPNKREDHKRREEDRAKRFLRSQNVRWPSAPNTFMNLLLLVLMCLLIYVVL